MNRPKPLNQEDRHQKELFDFYEECLQRSEIPQMEVEGFLAVADYCYLNQNPAKAAEVLKNALYIHPMDDDILCDLGLYQIECGLKDAARKTYEMISDKSEMFARELHASLLLMDGLMEEAMDELTDEDQEPFDSMEIARMLMRNGYKEEALAVLEKITPEDDDEKFVHLELMADLKTDLGCYQEAVKLYDQLLDMDPYDASNWYEQGCCHYKNDNLSKAIECLDYALVSNPDMSMAYQVRGECFILLGNIDKGIKDLTACARMGGMAWGDLLYFIHMDLIEKNNHKAAQKVLTVMSKLESTDKESRCELLLALSYVHAFLGENQKSEQAVDQALRLDPDSSRLRLTKGVIRLDLGDYYGGRKHLDKLVRECKDPLTMAHAAEIMLDRNHMTDALNYMDRAVSLESPENLCVNCLTEGHSTAMQFLAYEYCACKPSMGKLLEAYDAYHASDDERQRHNILTKVSRMLMSPSQEEGPKDRKNKNND